MAGTRIYSPQLGDDISNGLNSLGSLFAPPSPQQIQVAGTIANNQANQAVQAAARTNIQSGKATPADYATLGVADPAKQYGLADMYTYAKNNPGMAPSALDAESYALNGNASNTFAGIQSQPLNADQSRILPAANAAQMGVPQMQHGIVDLGDNTKMLAGGPRQQQIVGAPDDGKPGSPDDLAVSTILDYQKQRAAAAAGGQPAPAADPVVAAALGRLSGKGAGVTVNNGGDGGLNGAINKSYGAKVGDMVSADVQKGADAGSLMQDTATMRSAIASGGDNITFGPGAKAMLAIKQAGSSILGQNIPGTAEADVVNNVGYRLATAAARGISSRPTQVEFARALETKPGLAMSKQGSLALLDIMDQHAKSDQDIAGLANDPTPTTDSTGQPTTVGALNRSNWPAVKAAYYASHPIMSPFNKSVPFGANDIAQLTSAAGAAVSGMPPVPPTQQSSVAAGPGGGGAPQPASALITKTIGGQTYTKDPATGQWYAGQ